MNYDDLTKDFARAAAQLAAHQSAEGWPAGTPVYELSIFTRDGGTWTMRARGRYLGSVSKTGRVWRNGGAK